MDLLDFDAGPLYFDEPIELAAQQAIEQAAQRYGAQEAEHLLLRAYFLEPQHPLVLVALYRYYYYQHAYEDALRVAARVLRLFAERLGLPADWRQVEPGIVASVDAESMTVLRFYMLALKGAGYLALRLGQHEEGLARLRVVAACDDDDRLGAQALIDVARDAMQPDAEPDAARATAN